MWNGRTFRSAPALRNFFAHRSGSSWEAFLELHPTAARQMQLVGVKYGSTFYTKQALARWLSGHGQSFKAWVAMHGAAAAVLAAQPRNTSASERFTLSADRTLSDPHTLRVLAHTFPGATARIVVRAGSARLGSVPTVADYSGRVDSIVKLRRLSGHRHLTISLTAGYPEGPRTARAVVRVVQSLRTVSSR
jgi:hypothetical protein